ncbi:spore gernimation protein [Ammoniphilus oxalaticus]|uniref:Spore gernimation protein n=1 Tax=Ammoniphilus oxalaticus TaxID=66863 RepID=A0A419SGC8_9BACL|nr:endospore germination permease [Ammoniphilus oxalaticus]RKD22844.1 spore gernimation protein [Ammoniphilus oxalaticus]
MKLDNSKISSLQMAILIFPMVIATGDLLLPAVMSHHADRDAWISVILSSFIGFIVVYICYQLHKAYPKLTYIQYMESILGKPLGKCAGLLTLSYFIINNATVVRQYGEFIAGSFLPKTPMFFILGSMVLICACAVKAGLETLARLAEMFVPIIIILWILIILLLIPDMNFKNITPLMANGFLPVIKGAIPPAGWYTHVMIIAFLLPSVTDQEKGLKWGMISVFGIFLTLFFINLATLFVFGRITPSLMYPVMSAVSYISFAEFLEHLESVIMAIWVTGAFLKISLYFYIANLCFKQVFNLSNERSTVFPLAGLIIILSFWVSPNFQELVQFLRSVSPFVNLTFEMMIPAILLFTLIIRRTLLSS